MGLYNPYRVKVPLMRTNPEKGPDIDPGWVEITWKRRSALSRTIQEDQTGRPAEAGSVGRMGSAGNISHYMQGN